MDDRNADLLEDTANGAERMGIASRNIAPRLELVHLRGERDQLCIIQLGKAGPGLFGIDAKFCELGNHSLFAEECAHLLQGRLGSSGLNRFDGGCLHSRNT